MFLSDGNSSTFEHEGHGAINIYKDDPSTYNCGVGTVFYFGVIAAVLALLQTMCFLCSEKLLEDDEDEEEDEEEEELARQENGETTNLDMRHFQGQDQHVGNPAAHQHHKQQEMQQMGECSQL